MFLKHLEDHPSESYVVVLQFAKMKNFKGINTNLLPKGYFKQYIYHFGRLSISLFATGSVGVSNTTYNSKLFINANIPEIEDFQMRFLGLNFVFCRVLMFNFYLVWIVTNWNYILNHARLKSSDSQQGIQFSQLSDHASLTLEEEFLERGVYKSIADLKEVTQVY